MIGSVNMIGMPYRACGMMTEKDSITDLNLSLSLAMTNCSPTSAQQKTDISVDFLQQVANLGIVEWELSGELEVLA